MADNDSTTLQPRRQRWQDWANIILAIWLFISPWVLSFGPSAPVGGYGAPATYVATAGASNASWNAWIFGVIVFLVALSALSRMKLWQEWVNLLIGIWLFIAPWVLGFVRLPGAAWDHWIVGVLVFLVSIGGLAATRTAPVVPPQP